MIVAIHFEQMVDALENEISEYECETGREPTRLSAISGNFSGYTAALITAITKLMAYLKEVQYNYPISNHIQ